MNPTDVENDVREQDRRKAIEEEPAPAPPRPKRRVLPILLGLVLILALVGGWFWWHSRGRVSTDDAQVDGHIAPIAGRISGSVAQVLVDNNWHVKGGQILVQIDPRDYQARVDQAKAALAYAQSQAHAAAAGVPLTQETTQSGTSAAAAQLVAAQSELDRAQLAAQQASTSEIAAAQSNVESERANAERAQADLERMRPLVEKAEISRLQFDAYVAANRVAQAKLQNATDKLNSAKQMAQNANAAVQSARARVEAAKASLAQSRAGERQVTVHVAQAASASAAVEQARANLALAELQLSYTTITAPITGAVTRKTVEVGQMLQPGQALMTIIPLDDIWVTANFKETQLADVRKGQKAEIHVDMYGRTIVGKVDSIAGATGARLSLLPPENATGNFVKVVQRIPVKIVFDSLPPDVVLRPGMNVDATIITK